MMIEWSFGSEDQIKVFLRVPFGPQARIYFQLIQTISLQSTEKRAKDIFVLSKYYLTRFGAKPFPVKCWSKILMQNNNKWESSVFAFCRILMIFIPFDCKTIFSRCGKLIPALCVSFSVPGWPQRENANFFAGLHLSAKIFYCNKKILHERKRRKGCKIMWNYWRLFWSFH